MLLSYAMSSTLSNVNYAMYLKIAILELQVGFFTNFEIRKSA